MKISYDHEVDALSITFRETTVTTKHLAENEVVVADDVVDFHRCGVKQNPVFLTRRTR